MKTIYKALIAAIISIVGLSQVMAADINGGTKLYLKAPHWMADNARFAAYFFVNDQTNAWEDCTLVPNETNIYEVTAPEGTWPNVIFCRMNPSATENNWNNKWNQSANQTYDGTNNLFTVNDGEWNNASGTWSTYTPPITDPSVTLSANPTEVLLFNPITLTASVANASGVTPIIQHKTESGSWENITLDESNAYTPQTDGEHVFHATILVDEILYESDEITVNVKPYYVAHAGSGNNLGIGSENWSSTATKMESGTYTFTNVAVGNDYQFKITDGAWDYQKGWTERANEENISDGGDNRIKVNVTSPSDVTISFDGSKISVVVTPIASAPSVTANAASDITNTSAKLHAAITSKGSDDITEYGFYYATATGVSETSTKIQVATTNPTSFPHDYSFDLTGLQEATTYYYKAYATNAQGTTLSDDELSFTTKGLFVAGNGTVEGSEGKWCNGANWSTTASPMTNGSITFEKVPAGNDYRFVVTNGAWHTETGGADWGYDDLKENGSNIELSNVDGNIMFALNSVSDVTISMDENYKISVNITTIQLEADAKQVALNTPITLTPSAIGDVDISAVSYSVKTPDDTNWDDCALPYTPKKAGIYTFKAEADGFTSNEVQVTVCPEVTVYVHIPTEIWANPTTVSYYNWDTNTSGSFVGATALGDNWYSYTFDNLYDFGIIVVNGTAFPDDSHLSYRTANIENLSLDRFCFRLGDGGYNANRTVTQLTPSIEFTNIPASVSAGSTIALELTIIDAPAIFPITVERQTSADTWETITADADGSYSYTPTEAGTCTFRASFEVNGQAYSTTATVNVVAPTITLTATPNEVLLFNPITLSYTTENVEEGTEVLVKHQLPDEVWETLEATDGTYSFVPQTDGTHVFQAEMTVNGVLYTSECNVNVTPYYIAHNGDDNTLGTGDLQPATTKMINGSYTFEGLAANVKYLFKITNGAWASNGGKDWGFDAVKQDCCENVTITSEGGNYKNIGLTLSAPSDVTITFDGTKICVKAEQVERYRLLSTLADNTTCASNEVSHNGDVMSVYTQSAGSLQLQKMINGEWQNVTTAPAVSHTENNVIVAPLALADDGTVSVGTVSNYTGDYYIRTDVANGGWNNYKTNVDNKFTYFEANRTFGNETYNHYWVKYFEGERNTKAAVANDYNESLADELGDNFRNNMNVRFSYDNTTNSFNRVYLERSIVGDNPNPTFLQIFGTNIYTSEGGEISETGKQSFTDISNWVYEFNLKAQPEAKITIVANNNSERLVEDAVILGENSSFGGEFGNERYDMRVIYDFKKNRWVASWLPNLSDMTITEGMKIHVDANMMLVRNHNNKVNSFNITDANSYIDQIQHIYFVMELERDTLFNNDGSRKFSHLFWFSLPYSCKISEIFGIEGYNKKWVIQRYRGDMRAEHSWTTDIETFWANMKSTATLEAHRGYVLALNLSRNDFNEIKIDDQGTTKAILRLYFPSVEENFKLSQSSSNTEVNVPAHECNVNGRDSVDSHWNVIGIPGFQSVNMKSYSDQSGFDAFAGNEAPNFLYEWKGTHDAYEVVSGTSITYQHFYSYMVQFAGTIDWGQFTQGTSETTPAAVRAQRSPQAYRQDTYRINLAGEDAEDRTFIRLSTDGTDGYVTNQDLEKINNSQLAQIYTLGAGTRLAANTLPRETQAVSVGLNIPANGTYTLSLDENGQSVTAILYDKWENVYTDLSRDSYEFTQMEGRCEDRFEIQFSAEPTVPTDVEEANAAFIRLDGRTLRIVGGNDGDNVAVYDMAGRCLLRTQQTADFSFEIPVSGVYVLDIQGKKQKVVIK